MNTESPTDLFLNLTPERVLDAVERAGLRCNPVCYPLNSYENRVYDIELEDETHVVAKFYRPRRWTEAQILEEHQFLDDLVADEVPVCPVLRFPDGGTLKTIDDIAYCLYERKGGRAPQELDEALAERLGMLVARLHNVGARRQALHRVRLSADNYVRSDVAWLSAEEAIPPHLRGRYTDAACTIADLADQWLAGVETIRVHGDFHVGNLLLREGIVHVLDFDDMVVGPPVQDLWLLLPGRDDETVRLREAFLEGYEQFRAFDRATLRLVEPLRALRVVHYAAWLARRWHDPAFPATWPHFGTESYWDEETRDLEELVARIRDLDATPETRAAAEDPGVLTNKDFFWDWEER